ncbi:hypothetical protein V6Z11_A10G247400 [Gossypium hirsutum]
MAPEGDILLSPRRPKEEGPLLLPFESVSDDGDELRRRDPRDPGDGMMGRRQCKWRQVALGFAASVFFFLLVVWACL